MSKNALTATQEAHMQKVLDLLNRVNSDNHTPEDETEVRELLNKIPEAAVIMGDLVRLNRGVLIKKTIEGKTSQISLEVQTRQMKADLGFEQSPLLERMVIDNIIDGWLYMQHVQHHLSHWLNRNGTGFDAAAYWEKRMNAAQGRFLRACTVLARIRKMQLPAVQVNIAQHQMNQMVSK